jgi:hypothetical protein
MPSQDQYQFHDLCLRYVDTQAFADPAEKRTAIECCTSSDLHCPMKDKAIGAIMASIELNEKIAVNKVKHVTRPQRGLIRPRESSIFPHIIWWK